MKKYQLPKDFATKWVAALRSGEYKQITGLFKGSDNCYCSLGLAYAANGCEFNNGGLPIILNKDIMDPLLGELYRVVLKMNDNELKSFPQIADFIEENVEFI